MKSLFELCREREIELVKKAGEKKIAIAKAFCFKSGNSFWHQYKLSDTPEVYHVISEPVKSIVPQQDLPETIIIGSEGASPRLFIQNNNLDALAKEYNQFTVIRARDGQEIKMVATQILFSSHIVYNLMVQSRTSNRNHVAFVPLINVK